MTDQLQFQAEAYAREYERDRAETKGKWYTHNDVRLAAFSGHIAGHAAGVATRDEYWQGLPPYRALTEQLTARDAELAAANEHIHAIRAAINARSENVVNDINFLIEERDELRAECERLTKDCGIMHAGDQRVIDGLNAEVERLRKITHDNAPEDYLTPFENELLTNEKKLKAQLAEAVASLSGLLADTQHADHHCDGEQCPVEEARATLAKLNGRT